MRRLFSTSLLTLLWILSAVPAVAAPKVAAQQDSFVDWYLGQLAHESSTTSLRREDKVVVPEAYATQFLRDLERRFGTLKLRDVPPAGRVYLTQTDYLNTGKLLSSLLGYSAAIPEGSIKPKIRVRKYLTRDRAGKVRPSALTDGVSLLEVKMPHPTQAGVSLKPRLYVNDSQLKLLLNRKRYADEPTRAAVVQTLKADSRNDAATVDRMVALLGALHDRHESKKLKPWVQTEYQRNAYLIPLPGGAEVQITVDKEVEYRDPRKGKVVGGLKPSWRAVEVKIPDAYARMSDPQLRAQGLGTVAEVRQLQRDVLTTHRVRQLEGGRGKCAAFSALAGKSAKTLKARDSWR
jgi:hypothetical protein